MPFEPVAPAQRVDPSILTKRQNEAFGPLLHCECYRSETTNICRKHCVTDVIQKNDRLR